MSLTGEAFGTLPDGSPVIRYTLRRAGGLTLRVLELWRHRPEPGGA